MGWTKHEDAVRLHRSALLESHNKVSKLIHGVYRGSALDAFLDLQDFLRLEHCLRGNVVEHINVEEALLAIPPITIILRRVKK
jgi:hypothetical protein